MIVKGLVCKNRIFYYCVVCSEFFEVENPCEHFIDWDVKKVNENELDCIDEGIEFIVKLNYEVKIIDNEAN
ncbi:TPA: hypothetical protein [Aquificae Conch Spring virus]|nr:TPA: hypothetical protein [Aquificae Conch Spring virus]